MTKAKSRFGEFIQENIVTIFFVFLCIISFRISGLKFNFVLSEVMGRLFRNSILVMSLLIPVLAGVGLNFGIVLGAMSAQAALILVTHWRIQGINAILLAVCICTPISIVLGWLLGKLFNKTKGQEMITGMIAGYFANGIYQFIFLVLFGTLIPFTDERLMIYTGVGLKDTIALEKSVVGVLDKMWRIKLNVLINYAFYGILALLLLLTIKALADRKHGKKVSNSVFVSYFLYAAITVTVFILNRTCKTFYTATSFYKVPMVPLILTILMGLMMNMIVKTKLGQNFRAIGNNMKVAASAGVDVDRTRIIAIILSTVMASWGQIIFLQNMGNFTTYSSHENVGTFAVAAILVGGASVNKATVKQAIIGILLFHTLFVVSPAAGKALLNDAAYGEYFRTFISYGVIAVALVLHVIGRSKNPSSGEENS